MAKSKSTSDFSFYFKPRNDKQREAVECWKRSRILFLQGPAGVGKTAIGLALAVQEALKPESKFSRLWLSRPLVQCDEDIGLLPGDLNEKMGAWITPFSDVFGSLSTDRWESLQQKIEIETVPLGMLRGRTIRNGTLIVDEAQNATYAQLKCALTRLGECSRIVICSDPEQSDRYSAASQVPAQQIANNLCSLDAVGVVRFEVEDIVRDPLVSEILKRI